MPSRLSGAAATVKFTSSPIVTRLRPPSVVALPAAVAVAPPPPAAETVSMPLSIRKKLFAEVTAIVPVERTCTDGDTIVRAAVLLVA